MKKRIVLVTIVLLLAATLAAVYLYGQNQYQLRLDGNGQQSGIFTDDSKKNTAPAETSVTMVVTEDTISDLEQYPELESADLTGSTCYGAILAYMADHPQVTVTYTVDLGGSEVENTADTLTLTEGSFDFDVLLDNLQYLPQITKVSLPSTELTSQQITDLRSRYAEVDILYTVSFLGRELEEDATELDASGMTVEDLEQLCCVVEKLPVLDTLELMDEEGQSELTVTDVKTILDVCPDVTVHYSFDFYGTTLSTSDETVELHKANIGDEGEETIRAALDILTNCTYFKLDNCGVSSEVMASIREDYPDTKVVWRVFFGKYNCLTDTEMLRITNGLVDSIVGELKYCNDVKYMDAGHDEHLTDISFIAYMPKLEICILSGSPITDLSCFQDHQSIEFLELCFCSYIKDLTPLTNCTNLKYLNISYTGVKDLSPLAELPIVRFNCMQTKVSTTESNNFTAQHPDCLTRFTGTQCYGYGWRYVDDGITFWDYYANMRVIFMYDNEYYISGKEYTG